MSEAAIITDIKDFLIKHRVVIGMFNKYGIDIEVVRSIPICFAELPVSAKTRDRVIFINKNFLSDGQFSDDIHYIVHEMCHYLQQITGIARTMGSLAVDYLDLPTELEAFMYQIRFMRDFYGDDVAEKYTNDLLDFHEYTGEERKRKRKLLLGE